MADDSQDRSYDPVKDASAQEPLTPNEVKLVTRLFGDPFSFPLEFKAWLRGWLEEQFPRIGTLAISAETGAAGAFVPPAGAILDYGGDVAPGGYVLCDGAEYDKTSLVYQRLYNAIGTKYGSSGGNMFNVPDFRGRMSVGKGTKSDVDTMGENEGLAVASRGVKHRHNGSMSGTLSGTSGAAGSHGGHANGVSLVSGYSFAGAATAWANGAFNGDPGNHQHSLSVSGSVSGAVGDGSGPLDTPAYLVVNKIISLGA